MLPTNKKHMMKVLTWGGGVAALLAAASLVKFPVTVASGVVAGAALGIFNVYSIVRLVEALAGAATAGPGAGKASKALVGFVHMFKLGLIFVTLILLVYMKLINLFGVLAGFTVVLAANLFAGMGRLKADAGTPE
ncbi:MAG: hypothetical protein HZC51_11240 [Nitrospirae bacterium]|nr:hypothetical protein [Nitrospirota bacterium]